MVYLMELGEIKFYNLIYRNMKIKSYISFINEDLKSDLSPKLESDYKDLKEDIIEMIEKSLKTSDSKTFDDFVSAFIKNPDDTQIEGLINDSDVYEFYLKYRNDIDELLSKIKFYDDIPSEMSSFSLYDYVIKGTKKAIGELVSMIKDESKGESKPQESTDTTTEEQ
jgi:hypothetical protein